MKYSIPPHIDTYIHIAMHVSGLFISLWDSDNFSAKKIQTAIGSSIALGQCGWPNSEDNAYYSMEYELLVMYGCVLWGARVVVPTALRKAVLELLHYTHVGLIRIKQV